MTINRYTWRALSLMAHYPSLTVFEITARGTLRGWPASIFY